MTATNATDRQRRGRERYRPPAGVPLEHREWWGVAFSAAAHLLILALVLLPYWGRTRFVPPPGAGGPGPAGGGGGEAGARAAAAGAADGERLHFVAVRPAPPAPVQAEPVQPPVEKPKPPVEQPRKPVPQPKERVAPVVTRRSAAVDPNASAAPQITVAMGGAGDSGASSGKGPGSGGGTGTGTGTGRGSATGPGTGGGEGSIYPATPDFLVMPALPVPSGVRGKTIRLEFRLDDRGNIIALKFDPTGDADYDRELRSRLLEYRFRPAHKLDGTPVPSVYVTELTL